MTTSVSAATLPKSSSSSSSLKKEKRDKKKTTTDKEFSTEVKGKHVDTPAVSSRLIRYGGILDGVSVQPQNLSNPILVDDVGLIPKGSKSLADTSSETLLSLKRSSLENGEICLEGSTERLDLIATAMGTDLDQRYNYAVAIIPGDDYDGEPVRVWDAQMLRAERRIKRLKGVADSDAVRLGEAKPTSAADAGLDYRTAQNLLGEAFGTRKRKQAIASLEKNQVRADSLGQGANVFINQSLTKSAAEAPQKKAADENDGQGSGTGGAVLSASTALLPNFNRETHDVSAIYPISTLITQDVYKSLPVEEFRVLGASDEEGIARLKEKYGLKDYWMNRILGLVVVQHEDNADAKSARLRLVLFAHFLSSFRELRETAINGPTGSMNAVRERIPQCSEAMARDLLERFADRISRPGHSDDQVALAKAKHKLPPMYRDKALIHVLVVLLHLDRYRVNIPLVADFLAMTPTKLTGFFRALGCEIERSGRGEDCNMRLGDRIVPVKYARLTAPLKFPVLSTYKAKK